MAAQELADRFNVSRSPVNQALRLLHEKRVLAHKPNRGYFIGQTSSSSPQELGLASEDELSRVYLQIADDRLHGRLPAQVSESLLRERYGLTRAQLTAVLNRISQEGWVERRPGYGWEFSEMLVTPEALLQTYRVRMALEPAALLEPGYRLEPAAIERLRAAELSAPGRGARHRSARLACTSAASAFTRASSARAATRSSSTRCAASTASGACFPIAA